MQRSTFRHLERLRVRWAEVDLQHIVFNGHYLLYFDTAVAGYWRALALPYHDTMAALQGDLYVRKATLEYEGSARYDELLDVGVRCARIGTSSLTMAAAVFRGERCLVHGELVYVFADPATQTSQPVPAPLRAVFEGFEAGQAMVELRCGHWQAVADQAQAIRHAVFAQEQGIDAGLMVDAADPGAWHVLACNRLGRPLAGGRLLAPAPGVARIGRMATLASVRGAGIARQVLEALLRAARERGDGEVVLDAQATAVGFYERAGFVRAGAGFVEAGLPHVPMRRAL